MNFKSREILLGRCFTRLVCEGIYLIEKQVTRALKARWSKVGTCDFLFSVKKNPPLVQYVEFVLVHVLCVGWVCALLHESLVCFMM